MQKSFRGQHSSGNYRCIQIFICDFALCANPLVKLTRKDAPFEFDSDQIKVQEDLKTALIESPALHAINYMSLSPVIYAIDMSYIAVGFHLCQCNDVNPQKQYYNRFCSIMLNN